MEEDSHDVQDVPNISRLKRDVVIILVQDRHHYTHRYTIPLDTYKADVRENGNTKMM